MPCTLADMLLPREHGGRTGGGKMACLAADAGGVVRSAVDAYFEGRLRPELEGETVFETRNSRYRLMDGVLFAASDPTMIGAELVGWLMDIDDGCTVSVGFRDGSRAVLVD